MRAFLLHLDIIMQIVLLARVIVEARYLTCRRNTLDLPAAEVLALIDAMMTNVHGLVSIHYHYSPPRCRPHPRYRSL